MEEELDCLRKKQQSFVFCLLGVAIVVGITWMNQKTGRASMDLARFSIGTALRLFLVGMAAISAMFLPGISGSTLLLIFGAYIPVITAVKAVLTLDFTCVPSLMFFGCGILAGAATVVKAIRFCLEKYRPQTVYMILGMMIGSLYAICMGPTTLETVQSALNIDNFHAVAMILGVALVYGLQKIKEKSARLS